MELSNKNPFKMVGLVLLVIGVADVGVMIYCIANAIAYSSSFNIFAVVAGVLLLRRGVKTARLVRWFSVFFITGLIGAMIIVPMSFPIDLLLTQLRLDPVNVISSFLFPVGVGALLAWIYTQLSTPEALNMLDKAGFSTEKPKTALFAGVAMVALISVFSILMLTGDNAHKALTLAKAQLGDGYKYHVSNISVSANSGRASVTAFNDSEIKNVRVEW